MNTPPPQTFANLGIVIPTYNEIANIEPLLHKLLALFPQATLLFVDDNSPDRTWEVIERFSKKYSNVILSKRTKKDGLGNAYKHGFAKILDYPVDKIVQLDADFSHPLQSIPTMLTLADTYDMVIGSRYKDGISVINWNLSRIFISSFGNHFIKWITHLPLSDISSGFACYRRRALEAIRFDAMRTKNYCFQIEIKFVLHKLGYTLYEHPIVFTNRKVGFSKLEVTKTINEAIFKIAPLPFRSISPYQRSPHSSPPPK